MVFFATNQENFYLHIYIYVQCVCVIKRKHNKQNIALKCLEKQKQIIEYHKSVNKQTEWKQTRNK